MLDVDRMCTSHRTAPECATAPVLVPTRPDAVVRLGGALNVWNILHTLGAPACALTTWGNDAGRAILEQLTAGQHVRYVGADTTNPTTVKERVYCDGRLLCRLDTDRGPELPETLKQLELEAIDYIDNGAVKVLVLSDYGKGVLAAPQRIIAAARKRNIPVLVDPKGTDWSKYDGATLIKPNKAEYAHATSGCECDYELITMGEGGMLLDDGEDDSGGVRLEGIPRTVVDVTGAGDVACAALAVGYLHGLHPYNAARIANILASKSVEYQGVKTFTRKEASDECRSHGIEFPQG